MCFVAGLLELSRLVSHVYLSASDFAGSWVDLVGDDTGLVCASSPFWRQFFNSVILHRCKAALVCLSKWVAFHTGTSGPYHGFSSTASAWELFRCCSQLLSPFSLVVTFSSWVSVWESVCCCSQLLSPFSLARTLVVRNTAAFSPSGTHTQMHIRWTSYAWKPQLERKSSRLAKASQWIKPRW